MKVVETVSEFRSLLAGLPRPLGLVPTMGYLHDGHMALVSNARDENGSLVVSIFVNPAQFGPNEDFTTYPRDVESDMAKLEDADVDVVFTPSLAEMYPEGFDTYVEVGRLGERLEGTSRPGHFRGVATVVTKLLAVTRPDKAYFGEKDAQQSLVVSRLTADLELGAEIVVVPTVRESDGLALSSRNVYLNQGERRAALVLYRSLRLAREMRRDGVQEAESLRAGMRELMQAEPLAEIDYVSVSNAETLEELERIEGPARALVAVRIGETRLIDNMLL